MKLTNIVRAVGALFQFQDVRAILNRNPKGYKVLDEYEKHNTLSSESRQTLVKIAVSQLIEVCGP